MKMDTGDKKAVFLGRFQPLHVGHRKAIENTRDRFGELVVAVGSADKSREEDNPLSFEERKAIIEDCFPELRIVPVEDDEKDEEGNRRWAENIEELGADVVVSNNDLVKELVEEHTSMEAVEQEMHEPDVYSGTEVRRRIRSGEEWRYLVPECARDRIEQHIEAIRDSGIQYDFRPGWKKENIQN
ncbi:MAG: adenylyltransferase/cytidyltransferase family protein [Candidatus Nanohaloarchaea archaeon]